MEYLNNNTTKIINILKADNEECVNKINSSIKTINNLLDYIENNLCINTENNENLLTLSKISKKLNYSPTIIQTLFKKYCKITIHEYILKRKMSLASYDLIQTTDNIIDIATKYGYNPDSFNRAFKKIYSCSPTSYRKNGKLSKDFKRIELVIVNYEDVNLIETNCNHCDWRIYDNNKIICAGFNKSISELLKRYPNGCDSFEYDIDSYIENENIKEKLFKEF